MCRRYLPHGRRQGRYWVADDLHGVKGRFLIAATVLTPEHGDFNDDLAALGPPALAARLAPLLGPGP